MNEEILRNGWRDSKNLMEKYDLPGLNPEKMETALDRLIKRYKRFSIVSAVMMVFIVLFFGQEFPFKQEWRIWIIALFFIEFLAAALTDLWLTHHLGKINVYRMSVSEIISICRSAKKCHLRFVCFSLPYVFIVIGLFIYSIKDLSPWYVISICCGAIAGLIIGINKLIEFMRDYREMQV